jgi:hypothetical protein
MPGLLPDDSCKETTHQQGASRDVQHSDDRIFTERSVRLGGVAMTQPRLDEAPPEGIFDEGDNSGGMSSGHKRRSRTARGESGVPVTADIRRPFKPLLLEPKGDIAGLA